MAKKEKEEFDALVINEKEQARVSAEENIRKTLSADYENQLKLLQQANADNEGRLKTARQKELEYLKKEQELKNKEQELEIELQKKLQQERQNISEQIRRQEAEKYN